MTSLSGELEEDDVGSRTQNSGQAGASESSHQSDSTDDYVRRWLATDADFAAATIAARSRATEIDNALMQAAHSVSEVAAGSLLTWSRQPRALHWEVELRLPHQLRRASLQLQPGRASVLIVGSVERRVAGNLERNVQLAQIDDDLVRSFLVVLLVSLSVAVPVAAS